MRISGLTIIGGFTHTQSGLIPPGFEPPDPPSTVEYLIVAGGGGGGVGGGGGAGGFLTGNASISAGTTTITIGAGGVTTWISAVLYNIDGNGANSSIVTPDSTRTSALGGGAGATSNTLNSGGFVASNGGTYKGAIGGSGGGSGGNSNDNGTRVLGGVGTAGPPRQGYNGGDCYGRGGSPGGGGGGAGGVGGDGNSGVVGAGGIGALSSIMGTSTYYAGGGGGGSYDASPAGAGGLGGGGRGSIGSATANSGNVNTGGGGGGNSGAGGTSGSGGSGTVIIRYADTFPSATSTTGSPNVIVSGGYKIYQWTSSGSITF